MDYYTPCTPKAAPAHTKKPVRRPQNFNKSQNPSKHLHPPSPQNCSLHPHTTLQIINNMVIPAKSKLNIRPWWFTIYMSAQQPICYTFFLFFPIFSQFWGFLQDKNALHEKPELGTPKPPIPVIIASNLLQNLKPKISILN